jgi:hypothetical protein
MTDNYMYNDEEYDEYLETLNIDEEDVEAIDPTVEDSTDPSPTTQSDESSTSHTAEGPPPTAPARKLRPRRKLGGSSINISNKITNM